MKELTWDGEMDRGVMCDPIMDFLGDFIVENQEFLKEMCNSSSSSSSSTLENKKKRFTFEDIKQRLRNYVETREESKKELLKVLNVSKLVFPCLEMDVPLIIISEYNKMPDDDPRVLFYRTDMLYGQHLREFGCMVDKYDGVKGAICRLAWSTVDNSVMIMPDVGLNPYPTCWHCDKNFGTSRCGKCFIARYCGKECQTANWQKEHKMWCSSLTKQLSRVTLLEF